MKLTTLSSACKLTFFLIISLVLVGLHSCVDETAEDPQASSSTSTNTSPSTSQTTWMRQDGQSYLKFSGSTAYLCNVSTHTEWKGSYNKAASEMSFVISGTKYTMPLEFKKGELFVTQKYSANNVEVQRYISSNKYACSTSSGTPQGTTTTGTITFWMRKDNGCGKLSVTISQYGTKSITKFYTSSNPDCNASGCANFTNLRDGYYNYTVTNSSNCKSTGQVRLVGNCAWVRLD